MKRFRCQLLALLVAVCPYPAMACDPGPYPIIFVGASMKLSEPSKRLLNNIGEYSSAPTMRQMLKWYGSKTDSVQQARVQAVVSYLGKRGFPRTQLSVVHANTPPRTFGFGQDRVHATLSIETVKGGCGR